MCTKNLFHSQSINKNNSQDNLPITLLSFPFVQLNYHTISSIYKKGGDARSLVGSLKKNALLTVSINCINCCNHKNCSSLEGLAHMFPISSSVVQIEEKEVEASMSRTMFQKSPTDLLSIVYKYSIGYACCLNTSELTAGLLGTKQATESQGHEADKREEIIFREKSQNKKEPAVKFWRSV